MNFEEFCNDKNNLNKAKTMEKNMNVNYDDLVNKYKGKSNSELYEELLKVVSQEKAKGNLNRQQLNNIYNTISPMMNENEKENLKRLIDIIG